MVPKRKFVIVLVVLLASLLVACDAQQRFTAPEIEPPSDLIPSYVPEGFELKSGFQLPGEINLPEFELRRVDSFFKAKSPNGNVIQGVYYQGETYLILITKSDFPEGTLDDWMAAYEASLPQDCDCDCAGASFLRLNDIQFPLRMMEYQEERTINGSRVAILKGLVGWTTVFVRGDSLLTVESGISLDENLKIVESLLEN